jgi:hypothetical protein
MQVILIKVKMFNTLVTDPGRCRWLTRTQQGGDCQQPSADTPLQPAPNDVAAPPPPQTLKHWHNVEPYVMCAAQSLYSILPAAGFTPIVDHAPTAIAQPVRPAWLEL